MSGYPGKHFAWPCRHQQNVSPQEDMQCLGVGSPGYSLSSAGIPMTLVYILDNSPLSDMFLQIVSFSGLSFDSLDPYTF